MIPDDVTNATLQAQLDAMALVMVDTHAILLRLDELLDLVMPTLQSPMAAAMLATGPPPGYGN